MTKGRGAGGRALDVEQWLNSLTPKNRLILLVGILVSLTFVFGIYPRLPREVQAAAFGSFGTLIGAFVGGWLALQAQKETHQHQREEGRVERQLVALYELRDSIDHCMLIMSSVVISHNLRSFNRAEEIVRLNKLQSIVERIIDDECHDLCTEVIGFCSLMVSSPSEFYENNIDELMKFNSIYGKAINSIRRVIMELELN